MFFDSTTHSSARTGSVVKLFTVEEASRRLRVGTPLVAIPVNVVSAYGNIERFRNYSTDTQPQLDPDSLAKRATKIKMKLRYVIPNKHNRGFVIGL
ncbi:MAG: hypothetical protein P8L44_05780, partial [Opitutales bacterium]|nr:hypothetical protein [Opitutales bacterium]